MTWIQPSRTFDLPGNTVHIWRSHLDVSETQRQEYYRVLNFAERERAARYRFDEPRNRFIVSRGVLRLLISQYTHHLPENIAFQNNVWGKPFLVDDMETHLEFNIAHSNNLGLYAFSRNRAVGIDVEFIHPIEDVDQLVINFFSESEQQIYGQLPESQQLHEFFVCWSRKEAYIKGRGKGLSIPLSSFDVTLGSDEPCALLADRTDEKAVQDWKIKDVEVGSGYTATLAVGGGQDACDVCCFNFDKEYIFGGDAR